MLHFERQLKKSGVDLIIGVDEAGRGPLAGPVVAGAVVLADKRFKCRIDDSKKLAASARQKAFLEITESSLFGVGIINEQIIDRLNILVCTRLAMENAVLSLLSKIQDSGTTKIHILIDGNLKLGIDYPSTSIIRGDSRSKSIAAASIIAKVTRDRIMVIYDKIFPGYGFARHKGYPTQAHRSLLKKIGPSLIHRRSFYGVL
ncbi:MAG: ribonuclease HII [Candidatus Omnitrophota bacterium]|nr:ribonuclease HII [Candidatus Omnitrophota bacterium]